MSKPEKTNAIFYLFGKMWHYSEGRHGNILLFWGLFTIANFVSLVLNPLLWAKVINTIQSQGISSTNLKGTLVLLALTTVVDFAFWMFHGPARIIEQVNAFWARVNYRRFLLKGTMTQPLEWHVDHHSGDTIDKIGKGTTALFEFSEDTFELISAVVQLAVSYVMLAYYCHSASIIVLVMIASAILITVRIDRRIIKQYSGLNHIDNQISSSVFDAISNITTIIILRTERLVYRSIMEKVMKPLGLFKQNIAANELKWFMTSMVCSIMTVVVLGAFLLENVLLHQKILLGSFFLLLKYLEKISDLFYRFAAMYAGFLRRKAMIMNSEELTTDFRVENFTNHVLPENWKRLEIKGLDFSYNGDDQKLSNVSLSLEKGERIALVGETGSGKSTLLKVIRDLYSPQNLDLFIDGERADDGFGGIARAITLIPQEPEILATTILENITFGADYSFEEVQHAADLACFADVVDSLPKKFDCSVNEKGIDLSGGQKQRLALSRGFLACKDKDIILLDEPTSSIDTVIEMEIYQNIFREFDGKTVISSTHHPHILPLFDKIYVFDKGRVVGAGTVSELLGSCPKFKELWQKINEAKKN